MISKFIKKAFTIGELLFSLVAFGLGAFFAVNAVFKTSKSDNIPTEQVNNAGYFICYEDKIDNEHGSIYYKDIRGCNFEISDDIKNKEFFEIRLIGGGGGATSAQNGSNGEERVVNYPSLAQPLGFNKTSDKNCKIDNCEVCNPDGICLKCTDGYILDNNMCRINFIYRAVLGEGGKAGQNGGQTSLVLVEKTSGKILKILETAAGGIASNSTESKITAIMNGTTSDFGSGSGGVSPDGSGKSGEVKIQW